MNNIATSQHKHAYVCSVNMRGGQELDREQLFLFEPRLFSILPFNEPGVFLKKHRWRNLQNLRTAHLEIVVLFMNTLTNVGIP